MQLNDKRASLAAATLGLLGVAAANAQETVPTIPVEPASSTPDKRWQFDSALLLYSESDGRVQAVEPVLQGTRTFDGDRKFSAKLVLDTLTGASPNGATPASTPQTFSGPSGGGHSYTAAANETPLDSSFKDTRVAASGDYTRPAGDTGTMGFGLNASSEYDFLSAGANVHYTVDFNQHNTTLGAALGYEADTIRPVGGVPTPMAVLPAVPAEGEDEGGGGPGAPSSKTKGVLDAVVGLTQVLDPQSLVQVNVSLSTSSGYHTDPYKILSVVGPDGEPLRYVYESRPDSRTKEAVYARYKRFMFARDVFDLSYRFMTDDWGVMSHTVDTTYRWNFGDDRFIEPHLRWYTQGAADFYRAALDDGEETTIDFASADPRLGAFDAVTLGLKYGDTLRSGNSWDTRLEVYNQTGQRAGLPPNAAGGLSKFKLEPDLMAVMLTVGYRFKW